MSSMSGLAYDVTVRVPRRRRPLEDQTQTTRPPLVIPRPSSTPPPRIRKAAR